MIRAFDKWLLPWLLRRAPQAKGPRHVFLTVCDHFEPLHASNKPGAIDRIGVWQERFPALIKTFRDIDGEPPKHTFFYPIEQYDPDLLGPLADLCHETGSEVEVHLHHENDTPENLRQTLEQGKEDLGRHGLLARDESGAVRYAFIHGNWALNHCHPLGEGCGVPREIPILRSTGCYTDFTMPSAPSPTQCRVVNRVGYLSDLPGAEALNRLDPVRISEGAARREDESKLLMIQGPLALNWGWRKWGVIPRMENGDITGANPPTSQRFRLATRQGVSVEGRAEWLFVKLHTHGGVESNFHMLLGEPMRRFHEEMSRMADVYLHYVTAREMANLVHAAEDGKQGEPGEYRDYLFRL